MVRGVELVDATAVEVSALSRVASEIMATVVCAGEGAADFEAAAGRVHATGEEAKCAPGSIVALLEGSLCFEGRGKDGGGCQRDRESQACREPHFESL